MRYSLTIFTGTSDSANLRDYYINFCNTTLIVFQFILKFPILPVMVTDPNGNSYSEFPSKIDKLETKNDCKT